jgi:hypothetical protein
MSISFSVSEISISMGLEVSFGSFSKLSLLSFFLIFLFLLPFLLLLYVLYILDSWSYLYPVLSVSQFLWGILWVFEVN